MMLTLADVAPELEDGFEAASTSDVLVNGLAISGTLDSYQSCIAP
jgi:hypothetical protein